MKLSSLENYETEIEKSDKEDFVGVELLKSSREEGESEMHIGGDFCSGCSLNCSVIYVTLNAAAFLLKKQA